MKSKFKIFAGYVLAAFVFTGCSGRAFDHVNDFYIRAERADHKSDPAISAENFERLELGMPLEEALEIIGTEPGWSSSFPEGRSYQWTHQGRSIHIYGEDGRITDFGQWNLYHHPSDSRKILDEAVLGELRPGLLPEEAIAIIGRQPHHESRYFASGTEAATLIWHSLPEVSLTLLFTAGKLDGIFHTGWDEESDRLSLGEPLADLRMLSIGMTEAEVIDTMGENWVGSHTTSLFNRGTEELIWHGRDGMLSATLRRGNVVDFSYSRWSLILNQLIYFTEDVWAGINTVQSAEEAEALIGFPPSYRSFQWDRAGKTWTVRWESMEGDLIEVRFKEVVRELL